MTIDSLPFTPDLAVLCTNARRNPSCWTRWGKELQDLHNSLRPTGTISRTTRMRRTLSNAPAGPNSLGLLAPWQRTECQLFAGTDSSRQAGIYLPSLQRFQNTILDWAQQREMGFSITLLRLGIADIDVDDLLDFLARDSKTSAILLLLSI